MSIVDPEAFNILVKVAKKKGMPSDVLERLAGINFMSSPEDAEETEEVAPAANDDAASDDEEQPREDPKPKRGRRPKSAEPPSSATGHGSETPPNPEVLPRGLSD